MGGRLSHLWMGDSAAPASDSAGAVSPPASDERVRKLPELCTSSSSSAPLGGSSAPVCQTSGGSPADTLNKEWTWKIEACKDSVCLLEAGKVGTGWVVRNDQTAALVTARHVLQYALAGEDGEAERPLKGKVTATFPGGRTVDLSDARALLAPAAPGDGAAGPPDVAVVVLPSGRGFPARPVPCRLDTRRFSDVGGHGHYSLLHHPEGNAHVELDPRARLCTIDSSVSTVSRLWEVRYSAQTARGSSGGMLVDANCHAFAVHVKAEGVIKHAVLLSVIHDRLGDASPWHDLAPVVHQRVRAFHLPQVSKFFVGRAAALEELTEIIQAKGAAVVASTGLPGVGKSSLAVKWATGQERLGIYNVIAWLRAEHISDLEADLVALGKWLGVFLPASPDQSRRDEALLVKAYLEARPSVRTLLVFDNANDFRDLKEFVPQGPGCHSLVTARDKNRFPTTSVLPLDPFTMEESLALLRLVSCMATDGAAMRHAMDLCNEVGRLPLAVHVLASYARRNGLGFAEVLERVQGQVSSARALNMDGLQDYSRPESVISTVLMVLDELDADNRASLHRLAMLAPDRVPRDALLRGAETDRLYDFSIVSYPTDGFLSIHRLVQSIALGRMATDERKRVADELLADMLQFTRHFSDSNQETWVPVRVIATHAEALLKSMDVDTRAEAAKRSTESARWTLMKRLREYYIATAAFSAALLWSRTLASEMSTIFGPEESRTLTARSSIAGVLQDMGKFDEALGLYRAVEKARVVALGDGHPSLATTRHNMAGVLKDMGKFDDALGLYRAVEKAEVVALGDGHPSLATTRANMAGVLKDMGKLDDALLLYRAVEKAQVVALGDGHPSLATTRANMAAVLAAMGKLDKALVLSVPCSEDG